MLSPCRNEVGEATLASRARALGPLVLVPRHKPAAAFTLLPRIMPFTPWPSLIGGLMLSVSTSSVLSLDGRVLGISGITHGVVQSAVSPSSSGDTRKLTWRHAAFAGLLAGGAILGLNQLSFARLVGAPIFDAPLTSFSTSRAALAGLLVGFGTKVRAELVVGQIDPSSQIVPAP